MDLKRSLIAAAACAAAALAASPLAAETHRLVIDEAEITLSDGSRTAMTVNGTMPGPILRFKEGEEVVIPVTNNLDERSSVHWHGFILPSSQDGAPGFSYRGIEPGETFTYRFPIQQAGTYWYHSHSNMQEQRGVIGGIVIEPETPDPFAYDREYVLVLSDWHDSSPHTILGNLHRSPDYYNYHQRTLTTFADDVARKGIGATLEEREMWGDMRMMPTDIEDVSGYAYLVNGLDKEQNFTALFTPGERVRLRIVNASAMTVFDLRIPGLTMAVVQADGNNVVPVEADELRIAVAETYDVIVEPKDERAYTIFAQSIGRNGFARATLAPREGMEAPVPAMSPRPLLTMADMAGHHGMDHGSMDHGAMGHGGMAEGAMGVCTAEHAAMGHCSMEGDSAKPAQSHGMACTAEHAAMGHCQLQASGDAAFYAAGSGLVPVPAEAGGRFLSYADLRAIDPIYPERAPDRELTVRLTGNMERYSWSMNDEVFGVAEAIRLKEGERVRLKFVNETMMAHPMHLHGMWMLLDNGNGSHNPAKHVILVAPGTTVTADVEVDAVGHWPFHCHLMYHMKSGMMRRVIVEPMGGEERAGTMPSRLHAQHTGRAHR